MLLLALAAIGLPFAHAQGDDLTALSDEFSDDTLSRWQQHHVVEGWPSQLAVLDVNGTAPGQLYLEPYTSVWYAGFRAPFLFKNVTGDFVVSAMVKAAGKTKEFPEVEGSLVGLMVREPRQGSANTWKKDDETYVSFTNGLASGPGGTGPSLEITVTTRGSSPLEWRRSRQGWVELRMAPSGRHSCYCTASRGAPGPSRNSANGPHCWGDLVG